jgi:hypothetical protein
MDSTPLYLGFGIRLLTAVDITIKNVFGRITGRPFVFFFHTTEFYA